jgi:hypothetical protein
MPLLWLFFGAIVLAAILEALFPLLPLFLGGVAILLGLALLGIVFDFAVRTLRDHLT